MSSWIKVGKRARKPGEHRVHVCLSVLTSDAMWLAASQCYPSRMDCTTATHEPKQTLPFSRICVSAMRKVINTNAETVCIFSTFVLFTPPAGKDILPSWERKPSSAAGGVCPPGDGYCLPGGDLLWLRNCAGNFSCIISFNRASNHVR